MRRIISLLPVILFTISSYAQDIHLTQYYTSNLALNPALTGNYTGDIRVVTNYRRQWAQVNDPVQSNFLSAEKKWERYGDEYAGGILFVNDRLNTYNLHTNKIFLSGAYQKNINNNLIRVGAQGGVVFRNTDLSGQTFPDQWDYQSGEFNPGMGNGEGELKDSYMYADFNIGVAWTRVFNRTTVTGGYGLFHLTRPKQNFIGDRSLPFRHVVNASAVHPLSSSLSLIPRILYMRTGGATDFIVGSNARKQLNQDFSVLAGAGYRGSTVNSDALIAIVGFGYKRFDVGFSIDFNVSDLSQDARNKSALEFSIIYTTPRRYPARASIPCTRY